MKSLQSPSKRNRRCADVGAVLLVVLIVMVALLGLGMTGLFLTSSSIQMNTNINLRNQAIVVAEAGLERARGMLNNKNATPLLPALLTGSNPGAGDDVPTSTAACDGIAARGAILVDSLSPGCTAGPAFCKLQNVNYPNLANRGSDLPAASGTAAIQTMGQYTVYIRQDQADCRMGNFTCDNAESFIDGGVGSCVPPAGAPSPPNGAVVVRSEGVASDGRTRVVLEVTMTPSSGAAVAQNSPISALCSAGANGCDDNSSVQSGIVVNSEAPQTPPSTGGSGTGGATSAGGAGGNGTTTPLGGVGAGGAVTTGGAVGTGGASSSGGSGTGGNTGTGGSTPSCLKYAVLANVSCIDIEKLSQVTGNIGMASDPFSYPYPQTNNNCNNNCPGADQDTSTCISGSINYNVTPSYTASSYPAPSCGSWLSSLTVNSNQTINPGCYSGLDLNSGTLTLNPGNYVFQWNLNLNGGATLYVNGPVKLWSLNNAPQMNSTVTVNGGDPNNFWFIYNGTGEVNQNSTANFTGVMFFPVASIHVNYHVTGAVVCGKITLNGGASVNLPSQYCLQL